MAALNQSAAAAEVAASWREGKEAAAAAAAWWWESCWWSVLAPLLLLLPLLLLPAVEVDEGGKWRPLAVVDDGAAVAGVEGEATDPDGEPKLGRDEYPAGDVSDCSDVVSRLPSPLRESAGLSPPPPLPFSSMSSSSPLSSPENMWPPAPLDAPPWSIMGGGQPPPAAAAAAAAACCWYCCTRIHFFFRLEVGRDAGLVWLKICCER